jgi:hypothetical protein
MLASLAAGTVATTVCAPADVLKSRFQSSSSLIGKESVSFEQHGQDMVADAAAGGPESPAADFAGGRPVLLDARVDASVAQTDASNFSLLNLLFTNDFVRPNTVLMFIFMEQLQKLVDTPPWFRGKSELLQQASESPLISRAL